MGEGKRKLKNEVIAVRQALGSGDGDNEPRL